MTKLLWDAPGARVFETGVDRGVLYVNEFSVPPGGGAGSFGWSGYPWNGLTNVSIEPEGGEPEKFYMDGYSFLNRPTSSEFAANLEAFTYPDKFQSVIGLATKGNGLYVDNQDQSEFGLSYRTLIGNDTEDASHGYRIHLVYNAMTSPMSTDHATISDVADPSSFNWDISTRPELFPGYRPTAHLVVDSRQVDSVTLASLEDILYGTDTTRPRLPYPTEVLDLFAGALSIEVLKRPTTGMNLLERGGDIPDLAATTEDGMFTEPYGSRLNPTAIPGLYTLE